MSRYANTSDLTSRVHDHCGIIHFQFILFSLHYITLYCAFTIDLTMILIISVTNVNYNIQIKNITFTKNYVKQLIELIYKATINELFNAVHSEV